MRIALYQCVSKPLDVDGNLARLTEQAHQAARAGARVLMTPEMFLTGYDIGQETVAQLSQSADGDWARAVSRIARDTGVAILYGYPERTARGCCNSVQFIDRDGTALVNYRKTHLFGELDRAQFIASDHLAPLVELDGFKLGMLICYDVEFAENCRSLALAGADAILVPTANMKPYDFIAEITVRCRAQENQCYVAYANYCGEEGTLHYCGKSSLSGPDGSFSVASADDEALLIVDLDARLLADSRKAFPYLSDRRPSIYR